MTRRIKRSVSFIIIIAGIFITIPVMMAIALSLPGVQTLIIKKITGNISEKIESTISVGKIEYSFFNRLRLQDVLLKDKNNGTLLYVARAAAGIRKLDFRNNSIVLGRAVVTNPW